MFHISFAIGLDNEPYHEYKLDKKYFISKVDNSFLNGDFVDNDFWNNITPVPGLIQVEPHFNQRPSYRTDIKLCHDENYIFVLVDLFQDQSSISYKKGEYDDFSGTFDSNSDYFIIEIDSYHDHETGYSFAVNSSGIQADYIIYNDEFIDDDWNADWYTDVVNTNYGWQIKYKIPSHLISSGKLYSSSPTQQDKASIFLHIYIHTYILLLYINYIILYIYILYI